MVEHFRQEEGIVSEGGDNRRWQANQTHAVPKAGVARSGEQVEGLASSVLGTELDRTTLGLLFLFLRGSDYVALAVLGFTI